jgi:chaperone required for assembly of F1-ATPase
VKRLYTEVTVVEHSGGFGVSLDGRPIRTPGRTLLLLPTRALAEAVAAEWQAQKAQVRPHTMPLMQLAGTVVDHLPANRCGVEAAVLRFAETDSVCYRADAGQPAELLALQASLWDPLLDWLRKERGATLVTTSGILPISQPREEIAILARIVSAMDDWRLGAFQSAVASSGSFVIGLALIDGWIDADEALAAAELDAGFEADRWGEDAEATARRAVVAADLAAARVFADLAEA